MRRIADRFHHRMELHPAESFKVFLFAVKAFSAMGFLFVFGQVAATGGISRTAGVVLILAAVLDLLPQIVTLRMLSALPDIARDAEYLQLVLKLVAYTVLAATAAGAAPSPVLGMAAFVVLWTGSFLVEESVLFLVGDADNR
ncbi:MAG: hypothetical protein SVW02_03120 [Candidatus Nanohaloarchaea archaeon]|nr:hypothetical protein [Candidatus Nanohaloarchaea archaeon]